LHILAIAFYLLVKKHDLIKPMLTGWKHAQGRHVAPRETRGGSPLGLAIALLVAVAAVYAASGKLLHERTVPAAPPAAAATSAPASPSASPPAATLHSSTPGW